MAHDVRFEELPPGNGLHLIGGLGDPDLAAAGYVELEPGVSVTARSYVSLTPGFPADGRFELEPGPAEEVHTRMVVRRPADPADFSGTLVLEWLNVSSGRDAAPSYGFFGPELVRHGHAWVGLSAQHAGIETAPALVEVGDGAIPMQGIRQADPERYGTRRHPGDAHAFDLFTAIARALRAHHPDGPTADLDVTRVLAVGESQSAYALTTYVNGVHPLEHAIDGFFIHSRGGPAAPLGGPGGRIDLDAGRADTPVRIRDDLDVPVLVVETETDVLGHLNYLPARQDDTDRFRLWEIAGTAHADRSLVGDFESVLGCDGPVNRGQQRFVVRAALRHLDTWVGGGSAPPTAERLVVVDGDDGRPRFGLDDLGNVRGGVRTPYVDVPAEVLSGLTAPDASRICRLFGRTLPVPPDELRRRYPSVDDYLERYRAATDDAIAAGFVLPEDRHEVLADARTELITW